jgi:hypothetical protein
MAADSGERPLHINGSLFEEIDLTRLLGSHARPVPKRLELLKKGMSTLYPKIAALLWTLLPQVEGSPSLQSLAMCLHFIASGMATNQLKMLYAQAFNTCPRRCEEIR